MMALANNIMNKNKNLYLLRQAFYWFIASMLLLFEVKVLQSFLFCWLTYEMIPYLLLNLAEQTALCISAINAFYSFAACLISIYKDFTTDLYSEYESVNLNMTLKKKGLDESKAGKDVKSLGAFMTNFFKLSTQSPVPAQKDFNLTATSTSSMNSSSLSLLVGYHDSPLNKSVGSVHTRSQLKELLDNETCDSIIDPTDCSNFFTRDFGDNRFYRTGTSQFPLKTETAMEGIKFFLSRDESSHESRSPERRIYHRASYSSTTTAPTVHFEKNLKEMLALYGLNESDLESYELKLRIWLCNTIIRPLVDKIDELNSILTEKHSNIHVRIGQSSLDEIQSHKADLYNTILPFILPYLRVHSNQSYVVNRVRSLSQNIALEDFKWNSGGDISVRDPNISFNRTSEWNEQLPTDTELIWHFFCTYMDLHLSPSSIAISAVNESSKPFTNVYFVSSAKSGEIFPSALNTKMIQTYREERFYEIFFIRMTSTKPPSFELVIDGGDVVLSPMKETPANYWLVFIFFLAQIKKSSHQRIGHAHISSLQLDIFDL